MVVTGRLEVAVVLYTYCVVVTGRLEQAVVLYTYSVVVTGRLEEAVVLNSYSVVVTEWLKEAVPECWPAPLSVLLPEKHTAQLIPELPHCTALPTIVHGAHVDAQRLAVW